MGKDRHIGIHQQELEKGRTSTKEEKEKIYTLSPT
jgi:hypothetical protein